MQASKGIKAPSLTVFLGNLDSRVTDRHLYELGCQAGPVQHVKVQHDSDTNKKGFGFITYTELDSAIYCLGLYRGLLNLFGLPVNVNFANREVPADDITEQHTALLDKCKRMLVATAAEQNIPGAGPARRQQQSQRYTPYGAPLARHGRDKQQHQQQRGAGSGYEDSGSDHADAGTGYQRGGSSYQHTGAGHAGGYGAAGSSYAAPQQQQQAQVPVADWQARAAAAAAEAAARIEQPGAGQYTAAQGHQAGAKQQSYLHTQPPLPQPPLPQPQQYSYGQPRPAQQQHVALPPSGGYSTSSWGLHVQQQQQQQQKQQAQPPAPAPVPQYQYALPQAVTSQAYQYQPQLQLQHTQQPHMYAAAPSTAQPAADTALQQAQYAWQQQQYQAALQQQPQQVVLQVAQQPGAAPQQVIVQVPQQQQQQQQPPAGQYVYYYQ